MYNKQLKKIALLLLIGSFAGVVSAQVIPEMTVLKLGINPYTINATAALEVESTTKGFLPPRMKKSERDAITPTPAGLQVWCIDCDTSTEPASGQLCVYLGSSWAAISLVAPPAVLTTGKIGDASIAPSRVNYFQAIIKGTLVSVSNPLPTETGIVWKEIIGNDFATLPYLDALGGATAPVYKTLSVPIINTAGGPIVTPTFTTTSSTYTNPFYFRSYAKSALGINYGNSVVFNCALPKISTPLITFTPTNGNTNLLPLFAGTLTVNAGTTPLSITEYGYFCDQSDGYQVSGKMPLSTPASLAALNAALAAPTFTANPTIDLGVINFNPSYTGQYVFRYYAMAYGSTTPVYSNASYFTPTADPVTGGTAIATLVSVGALSLPVNFGLYYGPTGINSFFPVTFNVTKTGSYSAFSAATMTGATTGTSLPTVAAGIFNTLGNVTLNFPIVGTPGASLAGNVWTVNRITGNFATGSMPIANAVCNGTVATTIVDVISPTGKTWMDRNLGATHVAESMLDIRAFGCLYQWGRGNDGHASINWNPIISPVNGTITTAYAGDVPTGAGVYGFYIAVYNDWRTTSNDDLWQGVAGINNPCPALYRVPTYAEFANATSSVSTPSTAYNNFLKLPAGSYRNGGATGPHGSQTTLWTSTVGSSGNAQYMDFTSAGANPAFGARMFGKNVRCIKN